MAEFQYKAKDSKGRTRIGRITGNDKTDVKNKLRRMQLRPVSLAEAGGGGTMIGRPQKKKRGSFINFYKDESGKTQIEFGQKNPTAKDLIIFTKQFATMIESGVPIIQTLGVLGRQQRVRAFGEAITDVRTSVENGSTLSDALAQHPNVFDELYISMVRAGEASGQLEKILLKLADYVEKTEKIKGQVKSAMFYPIIITSVAAIAIAVLLIFVVPIFGQQFAESGKDLPELTKVVLDLSHYLQTEWMSLVGGLTGLIILFKISINTDGGRQKFDEIILRVPAIGELLRKIAVGRFCATMATMLTSGVSILEALSICARSSNNKMIEEFVLNVRQHVAAGETFAQPLAKDNIFPPMVVSMVAVGEATGALDEMLTKVSMFYEDDVDVAIKNMLAMIEPIMITLIGGIVGFIVIAMYLPIFELAGTVSG